MLCNIVGITAVFATNSVNHYQLAIVGYLAAGLVMTTSAVNSLIYQSEAAMQAAAAGFILLSIIVVSPTPRLYMV
jgi:SHO1 osmosensor